MLEWVNNRISAMSNTQKRIAEYVMEHPQEMCYLTLKQLADRAGVSEVTVLNFCHSLGLKSFTELRDRFREAEIKSPDLCEPIKDLERRYQESQNSDDKRFLNFALVQHSNYLESIQQNSAEEFFTIGKRILEAERVYVLGHDASKIPADYMVHRMRFMEISASAIQIGERHSVNALLANIREKDLLCFISLKDYHEPSRDIARFASSRGGETVVITDGKDSPVGTVAEHTLLCTAAAPLLFNSMSTVMSTIELLTAAVAVLLGDKLDEYVEEFLRVNRYLNGGS